MTADRIKQRVHSRTVRILSEQSQAGVAISLVIACLLAVVLWPGADHYQLAGWFFIIVTIGVGRIVLNHRYNRGRPVRYFHVISLATLVLNGTVWGSIIFLRLNSDTHIYETAIFFTIGGLVAGVVGKYSARTEAALCFSIPALLSLVVYCLMQPDRVHHFVLAVMTLVYLSAMVMTSLQINKMTRNSIELNESLNQQIFEREQATKALEEKEREQKELIGELQIALAKVKTLSGFLPICSSCKKIRDDQGYWNQIEMYVQSHSDAEFSHGICPDCAQELYPGIDMSEDPP